MSSTRAPFAGPKRSQEWGFRLFMIMLAGVLLMGPMGCNNKKKLAEEQARAEAEAQAAKIEQVKGELTALMASPVKDLSDLERRQRKLDEIQGLGLQDASVATMIKKVQYFLDTERERLKEEAKAEEAEMAVDALQSKIDNQFMSIAQASSVDVANRQISETLKMFSNENVPVLIIISEADGVVDYDRPTTVAKYLNYLKDQHKSPNAVKEVRTDGAGRISELVLVKTNR
ncbi:hypothetical protein [Pontibacter sp. G13]|uniref:hypothetical protein n=1 Tax=Pontibacter sp. G13 TaxID=3074898 RepID=UPI002889B6BD|nr:hypothetical protein [Pontibacter sp. G13]WNJ19670.1 hypothetical protein RJD25_04240 [Pontibacter sp. G13]